LRNPADLPPIIVQNRPTQRVRLFDKNGKEITGSGGGEPAATGAEMRIRIHGRSSVGAGRGLRAAVIQALQRARECDSDGVRNAKFLKIDVLQHVEKAPGFAVFGSPFRQPSVVGIAFPGETNTFVLLPEMVVPCVNHAGQLFVSTMPPMEDLSVTKDPARQMAEWMGLTARPLGNALFFEAQSWFTDGRGVDPMFRGHRMPAPLTAAAIRSAGSHAADFLCRQIGEDGAFLCSLPLWRPSGLLVKEGEAPETYLDAVLALQAWQEVEPSAERAAAIARCIRLLQQRLSAYPPVPGAKCLTNERFETGAAAAAPSSGRNAAPPDLFVAVLGANARLAAVLARQLAQQPYPAKDDADLLAVGAWLLSQQKPDGRFVTSRSLPSGAAGTDAAPEAETLAATALCRIYARTGRTEYLDAAEKALGALLKLAPLPKATAESIRLDAALVEAIDALFAASRNRTFIADAEKRGARLLEGQTTQPVFPDFLGGLTNSAELEPVAAQTRGVLTAAGLCHGVRHRLMAEKLFAAAHYGLIFQLQGQADAASTLHLPDGTEYGGAFRSSLAGCEFELATQAKALASLAAAAELLKTLGTETVPVSDDLKRDLQDSLARLGQFPRCLPPNPEANPTGKSP
jgi:hypothetical protein